jgi:hypothetical protein
MEEHLNNQMFLKERKAKVDTKRNIFQNLKVLHPILNSELINVEVEQ